VSPRDAPFPWALLGFALIFAAVAAALALSTRRFVATAVHADGVVVAILHEQEFEGATIGTEVGFPVVRFETTHGPRELKSTIGSDPPAFAVGERVVVLYPPGKPKEARLGTFWQLYLVPVVFAGLAGVFAAVGGVALAMAR
jgi:hypothetical protein